MHEISPNWLIPYVIFDTEDGQGTSPAFEEAAQLEQGRSIPPYNWRGGEGGGAKCSSGFKLEGGRIIARITLD